MFPPPNLEARISGSAEELYLAEKSKDGPALGQTAVQLPGETPVSSRDGRAHSVPRFRRRSAAPKRTPPGFRSPGAR